MLADVASQLGDLLRSEPVRSRGRRGAALWFEEECICLCFCNADVRTSAGQSSADAGGAKPEGARFAVAAVARSGWRAHFDHKYDVCARHAHAQSRQVVALVEFGLAARTPDGWR